ncbi:hypothetical protein M427DRAFT_49849 [Gonapodya prolifera JEL478]|uniref:SH3 domain-containing protein n=1 Tax=Gonapodya prolifera (strain JEL478) TaxID=1344416 RepID=A0A138ZXG4_GONPJ|nr:hypothetical protein M427DRAFT_49849 [Gonapodya prolifera JEL478]|eukprot:KXS09197.1 hypothetical protein M427DRAFT_49849 [Gonapodya prolifera JEL478]
MAAPLELPPPLAVLGYPVNKSFTAVAEYRAQGPDEMEVCMGDDIVVTWVYPDAWALAENPSNGRSGVIPIVVLGEAASLMPNMPGGTPPRAESMSVSLPVSHLMKSRPVVASPSPMSSTSIIRTLPRSIFSGRGWGGNSGLLGGGLQPEQYGQVQMSPSGHRVLAVPPPSILTNPAYGAPGGAGSDTGEDTVTAEDDSKSQNSPNPHLQPPIHLLPQLPLNTAPPSFAAPAPALPSLPRSLESPSTLIMTPAPSMAPGSISPLNMPGSSQPPSIPQYWTSRRFESSKSLGGGEQPYSFELGASRRLFPDSIADLQSTAPHPDYIRLGGSRNDTSHIVSKTFVALYQHVPGQPDELALQPGDRVFVLRINRDGWAQGWKAVEGEERGGDERPTYFPAGVLNLLGE